MSCYNLIVWFPLQCSLESEAEDYAGWNKFTFRPESKNAIALVEPIEHGLEFYKKYLNWLLIVLHCSIIVYTLEMSQSWDWLQNDHKDIFQPEDQL